MEAAARPWGFGWARTGPFRSPHLMGKNIGKTKKMYPGLKVTDSLTPENGCLEYSLMAHFQGRTVSFREGIYLEPQGTSFKWLAITWMIPDHYLKNGCFTKHLFQNGCLGFQAYIDIYASWALPNHWKTGGVREASKRVPFKKMNRLFNHSKPGFWQPQCTNI